MSQTAAGRDLWGDRVTLSSAPEASPAHIKPPSLQQNHLHLQPQSSVIPWFHYSIFKPVEWECFWVPCSHRWWWEESQEYTACSKCPFHYVITPFTSHMSRDDVILQTATERQVNNGSTASAYICVRNMKEDILPNYIHLRLWTS